MKKNEFNNFAYIFNSKLNQDYQARYKKIAYQFKEQTILFLFIML